MNQRATLPSILLVVSLWARAAWATPAPACQPGSLVFSAPYLPTDVLFLGPSKDLVVVDRGALTVRDPKTLAVKQMLLPRIDHWSHAELSPDGARLLAATVDGLRFSFDTTAWHATRLSDDRAVTPKAALGDSEMYLYMLRHLGTSQLAKGAPAKWSGLRDILGLPALANDVQAVAFAVGMVATRAGQTTLDPVRSGQSWTDPTILRAVLADSAGTLHLYDDRRELAVNRLFVGGHVVALAISGGRILVALDSGEVAILRPTLELEARVMVRRPPSVAPLPGRGGRAPTDHHGIMVVELDPVAHRLAWVSTDNVVGVFDLSTGRTLAEIAGTGPASLGALWVDERRVALLTSERVTLWDTSTGRLLHEHPAGFQALIPAPGGLLGVEAHGQGELLDPETLKPRRRICFLGSGCQESLRPPEGFPDAQWQRLSLEDKRRVAALDKARDEAAREIRVAVSPDARKLAVLHPPVEVREPGTVGDLALWDLSTLTRGRSVSVAQCFDWKIAYRSGTMLDVCGDQRRDARSLAIVSTGRQAPQHGGRNAEPQRTRVGTVGVTVWPYPDGDYIEVVARRKDQWLMEIAAPESKGNAPEDKIADRDRAQLRAHTLVLAAPGARRFLLAGLAVAEGGSLFPDFAAAAGPLQVWCAPTKPVDDPPLPVPEDPPTAEIDGITERALDGFPETITGAAQAGDRAYVLGMDLAGKTATLVSVGKGVSQAVTQTLPAGGPWKSVVPSPGGETIWLQGEASVARLGPDGAWKTFAVGAVAGSSAQFFAPLSADVAVYIAKHACSGAETAAIKAEPNLRLYYDHNARRFTDPRILEGNQIACLVDADGPNDQRAQANLRRCAEGVTALLRAPGGDFAALQARAVKDPAIHASSDLNLRITEGQLVGGDRPLNRLFAARPGEMVGPIATSTTEPQSGRVRLATRFVRVDRITAEKRHAFAEMVQSATTDQWWRFASHDGCKEVFVLGLPQPLMRTVLPPHASHDFVAWRGGFAAVGNGLLVFNDGAWSNPTSPLASLVAALGVGQVMAAGRRLYVQRADGLEVFSVATGKPERTVPLGEFIHATAVQGGEGGQDRLLVDQPGEPTEALLSIDAQGKATRLVQPRVPAWAGLVGAKLAPGQTARLFVTANALFLREDDHWTVVFNPAARRRGLALRRRGE